MSARKREMRMSRVALKPKLPAPDAACLLRDAVEAARAESVCLAVGAVVLADLVRTELEIPSKWGEAREALDAALLRAEALHVDFPTGPRAF